MALSIKVIGAIARSVMMSLVITVVVIAASIALMTMSPVLGVLVMLVYSSVMVVRSTRTDMPLNRFTALLPGAMALSCYLLQLAVSGVDDPTWPLLGILAGLGPGWLMGRGHRIYEKNGRVFAHRTFLYVLVWAVSFLLAQIALLLGLRQVAAIALGLGGFSTAMLVTLSLLLFRKAPGRGDPEFPSGTAAAGTWLVATVLGLLLAMTATTTVWALTVTSAQEAAVQAIRAGDLPPGARRMSANDRALRELSKNAPRLAPGARWGVTGLQIDAGNKTTYATIVAFHFENTTKFGELYDRITGDGIWESCGDVCLFRASDSLATGVVGASNWIVIMQLDRRVGGLPVSSQSNRRYLRETMSRALSRASPRLWTMQLSGPGTVRPQPSRPAPTPDRPGPTANDTAGDLGPSLETIADRLFGSGYSEGAVAVGLAAALIQLLAGMGLSAAMAAAQSAAQVASTAMQAGMPGAAIAADFLPTGNHVLDGSRADAWLRDNGYLDRTTGQPTDKLRDFLNAPHSESGTGLQGFAGDLDADGNPVGDFAITVPGPGDFDVDLPGVPEGEAPPVAEVPAPESLDMTAGAGFPAEPPLGESAGTGVDAAPLASDAPVVPPVQPPLPDTIPEHLANMVGQVRSEAGDSTLVQLLAAASGNGSDVIQASARGSSFSEDIGNLVDWFRRNRQAYEIPQDKLQQEGDSLSLDAVGEWISSWYDNTKRADIGDDVRLPTHLQERTPFSSSRDSPLGEAVERVNTSVHGEEVAAEIAKHDEVTGSEDKRLSEAATTVVRTVRAANQGAQTALEGTPASGATAAGIDWKGPDPTAFAEHIGTKDHSTYQDAVQAAWRSGRTQDWVLEGHVFDNPSNKEEVQALIDRNLENQRLCDPKDPYVNDLKRNERDLRRLYEVVPDAEVVKQFRTDG